MSIQFPDAPAQGDSFVATNGVSYTYDNGGWIANSQSALDDRFVNLDGDTMTGDLTVPSLNGGQLAGFRNQIINGNFEIVQRGAGGQATVSRVYTCDRWYVHNDTTETYTWDQQPAPASFVAAGFTKCLRVRNASGSTQYQVRQLIELPATGAAGPYVTGSTWTASIYADAPVDVRVQWRDDSTGDPGAVTELFPWSTMTALGGDRYSFTFTIENSPQATAQGLGVSFKRSDGTTSSIKVTGVQLEPGPVATPFEHRPIATELALCQRYFYNYTSTDCPGGTNRGLFMTTFMGGSGPRSGCVLRHPQTMRAIPTVSNLLVRDNPNANSVNDTTASYLVVISPDDNSSSNRYPAVNTFDCDAEL